MITAAATRTASAIIRPFIAEKTSEVVFDDALVVDVLWVVVCMLVCNSRTYETVTCSSVSVLLLLFLRYLLLKPTVADIRNGEFGVSLCR